TNPDRDLILRQFEAGDPAADDEARALRIIDTAGGLAPRLLARSGDVPDTTPWVLISRMPGTADIRPADPHRAARQLGETLARLHSAECGSSPQLQTVFERRGRRTRLSGPAASVVDALWHTTIAAAPLVLTHGDYQSGNVVWSGDRLTGVVDWEGAARGPAGYDLSWCRFDLYLLYGEPVADTCLRAYREAGGLVHDPYPWDLWTLARSHRSVETWVPNYRDLGRTDLTAAELRRRHTAWTTDLLRRHEG
ncbi:aminoglycoside phosphotransferase (APT) family kinase protein, partial [Prauserella sediminis]